MKNTLIAMLWVVFLYGCGASNKGLDTPIKGDTVKEFFANCGKVYAELKETNPTEFAAMRNEGSGFAFDLSQPHDQVSFATILTYGCQGIAETITHVAATENIALTTYREFHVWATKRDIDSTVEGIGYTRKNGEQWASKEETSKHLKEMATKVKSNQRLYTALTGKTYGPQEIDLSSVGKPEAVTASQPEQPAPPVATATPMSPMQPVAPSVAEPKPQQAPSVVPTAVPTSAAPTVANTVEQTGLCKGLDLAAHAAQIECLDRKYSSSDKQLNDAYKELMAGFDESRKSSLKKEQIAWIREKEAKCQTGGKDGGGGVATLANAECKLRFTEQRLGLLKNYK